jgi:hypothetical protein
VAIGLPIRPMPRNAIVGSVMVSLREVSLYDSNNDAVAAPIGRGQYNKPHSQQYRRQPEKKESWSLLAKL